MKVILIKDVPQLGKRFDVKNVSDGHAQNLLIPRGLAISATPAALKRIEAEKATAETERKVHEELLAKNLGELESATVIVSGKANPKGHLFAGLHRDAIAAELQQQTRIQVDPSFIMVEHPIKEVGEHMITVKAAGKTAQFKLIIQAGK